MDTSQTSSKTRNTRGQGNDCSGRLSHAPSPDIPAHSGRPLPVRSVDDDFFDLVKSEVKVVTLADIKAYLKITASPDPVSLQVSDTSIANVLDHLDKLQANFKVNRRIFASDTLLYLKEMPSAIHPRAASYVVEHVAFALRQCLPVNAAGGQNWDDIELAGDGRLTFGTFRAEPDAALAFAGQRIPFCVIECGYADSGRKTCGRAAHWIGRGKPDVAFSLAVKVGADALHNLTELEIVCFHNDMNTAVTTRQSVHGRTARYDWIDFVNTPKTQLKIPVHDFNNLPGVPAGFQIPVSGYVTVDFTSFRQKTTVTLPY